MLTLLKRESLYKLELTLESYLLDMIAIGVVSTTLVLGFGGGKRSLSCLGCYERRGGYCDGLKLFQSSRHERQRVALAPLSEAVRQKTQGCQAEPYIFYATLRRTTNAVFKIVYSYYAEIYT